MCLDLNLVTLNCSVQQGSPLYRTHEEVTLIKTKDDLVKRYPDCFDSVGKFQGQYHITVDLSVPPVVHAQRRVPLSLRDDIKDELDDMESCGIITKLKEGEPTAWVNSLVYCRKPNGKLRICPRSKQSYFQRASRDPYSRSSSPKTKRCQVLLHCCCKMCLLER